MSRYGNSSFITTVTHTAHFVHLFAGISSIPPSSSMVGALTTPDSFHNSAVNRKKELPTTSSTWSWKSWNQEIVCLIDLQPWKIVRQSS
eukprot:12770686-Ditylum_brightwellii.AAC.1